MVDDEDRENEGDLCMAAEKCTPEAVNFMAMYGRGLICLALIGGALYMQIVLGEAPCPLCILQRYALLLIGSIRALEAN